MWNVFENLVLPLVSALIVFGIVAFLFLFFQGQFYALKLLRATKKVGFHDVDRLAKETGLSKEIVERFLVIFKKNGLF